MAQTLLHYPSERLLTLNQLKNIALIDTLATDIGYNYYLYLLTDRTDVYTMAPETIETDIYTKITIDNSVDYNYRVGDQIYLLDESVDQTWKSGSFTIIQKISGQQYVISRPFNEGASASTTSLTINHSVGFIKSPSYVDGTGNFVLDKDLFDLRVTELSDVWRNTSQFKEIYGVWTYSSKAELGLTRFNGTVFTETLTGLDNPWLYTASSDGFTNNVDGSELNYSVGDVVAFTQPMPYEPFPDPGISYKAISSGGTVQNFLSIKSDGSVNFITDLFIQEFQTITLSLPDNGLFAANPFKRLNGPQSVKSVSATEVVFNKVLSTQQKKSVDDDSSFRSSGNWQYQGLSRSGSFTILDIDYDPIFEQYRLQISAPGLGIPTAVADPTNPTEDVYNAQPTFVALKSSNETLIQNVNVSKGNYISIVNSWEDPGEEYIIDGTFPGRKILSYDQGYSPGYNNGEQDRFGYNDLRFFNVVYSVDDNDRWQLDKLQMRIWKVDGGGGLIGGWTWELDVDNSGLDKTLNQMLSFCGTPAVMVESGKWLKRVGGSPLGINDFSDNCIYEIRTVGEFDITSSDPLRVSIVNECGFYRKMRLLYTDSMGTLAGLNFNLGNTFTFTQDSETYRSSDQSFKEGSYEMEQNILTGGTTITNKKVLLNVQLISNWLHPSEVEKFKQCFVSDELFLQKEDDSDIQKLAGVTLINTEWEDKYVTKDGLFQYTLNVVVNVDNNTYTW